MINTREDLVDALTEAAELEHGLLVQYLFAAFTMKRSLDEGLTPVQQALAADWESAVLAVAREEMGHLGLVCNLLAAIGGAPRFGRPNFPQRLRSYYPFDFSLTRFSDEALYRFVCFELPEGEPPPEPPASFGLKMAAFSAADVVPDPLVYQHVGELYANIRAAFLTIPEDELFIGPPFTQDADNWSIRLKLRLVTDRESAKQAIESILQDGEGAPTAREGSHYDTFKKIRKALNAAQGFDPARPVVSNPMTRLHRDASGQVNIISNPDALAVAELFNAVYATVLLMLMQYYSYGGESPSQRTALRSAIAQAMSGVIRPLAECLTLLPHADNAADGNAGPGFEIYSDLRLPTQLQNRFPILAERLAAETEAARALAGLDPRISLVGQHLEWLATNLKQAFQEY